MLCKIFHKSGAGPPNGDRYAPFIEEEWDEDAPLVVPGEVAEDDVAYGDKVRRDCTNTEQVLCMFCSFWCKNFSYGLDCSLIASKFMFSSNEIR